MAKLGRDYGVPGETNRTRKLSLESLKALVARDLQMAIRMEAADDNGICCCVSCGTLGHYKVMQGGHFVSRKFNATKFNEQNIHVQCENCNGHLKGNEWKHAEHIDKTYGAGTAQALRDLADAGRRYYRYEILNMRDGYRARIKIQKQRLGH